MTKFFLLLRRVPLVCLLVCAACSNTTTIQDGGPGKDSGLPADAFTLDFTNSPYGGMYLARSSLSVAFTIDLKSKNRAFVIADIENNSGPGMLQTNDVTGGCEYASMAALTYKLDSFPAGDSAKVGYIDVEMLASPNEQPIPLSGACYGYRMPKGGWTFVRDIAPLEFDESKQHLRAHVPVDKGPVDALKLIFGDTVPIRAVPRIVFTADPSP